MLLLMMLKAGDLLWSISGTESHLFINRFWTCVSSWGVWWSIIPPSISQKFLLSEWSGIELSELKMPMLEADFPADGECSHW